MPDGSNTDPHQKEQLSASCTGSVSHPLMGSRRTEPAVRNPSDHAPPPVNIRVTLPFLGGRYYFTLMSGKERRSKERLALERQANPLRTKRNIMFMVGSALFFYSVTLGTYLAFASAPEG